MRPLALRLLGLSVGVSALLCASDASAYVHTVTPHGCHPVHWAMPCVFVAADATGLGDLTPATVERIVQSALGSWQTDPRGGLSLEYVPPGSGAFDGRVADPRDGWQTITFRTEAWCRPADASGPALCYDAAANALTTITYVRDEDDPENDGRILDADIELNAVNAHFYDADAETRPVHDPERRPTDLWNTLTHELGHLQGLDHTCRGRSGSMPACARDDHAAPVALCADVESDHAVDSAMAAIYASTMYPSSKAAETSKRTPEADDLDAVASLYPSLGHAAACGVPTAVVATDEAVAPVVTASALGCTTGASRPSADASGWLFGLLAFVCVRRWA